MLLPGGLFSVAGMGKPEKPGVVGPMSEGRGPRPQQLQPTPASPFSRPSAHCLVSFLPWPRVPGGCPFLGWEDTGVCPVDGPFRKGTR